MKRGDDYKMEKFDIYVVGVGGQGVLTIGELISQAAVACELPVNVYPTKGMAQRGGFVKEQIRLGRENLGPSIPPQGAELVISMELSESLKALPFLRKGGEFVLYGLIWAPTEVMLGKEHYPSRQDVSREIAAAGGRIIYSDPSQLPQGVRENIFILGLAAGHTRLQEFIPAQSFRQAIEERWPAATAANLRAFDIGYNS